MSLLYSVSHVPEAVLSSRFSVLRVNRQHSAITQKNHAADERGFTQILANVDQLIRGGVLVTGRPGSPERAQTRVITGESQGQAGGLAGPFCVPSCSQVSGNFPGLFCQPCARSVTQSIRGRGRVQVTSRSGRSEMRRSLVITGENQGQGEGLAGPFLRFRTPRVVPAERAF